MQNRELKYGTYVLYKNQIGKIHSISNGMNVKIKNNKGDILDVEKKLLKTIPHDKGELIKYLENYYLISQINYDEGNSIPIYKLSYVNNNKKIENDLINCNDKKIINIEKEKQEPTIRYLKWMDRYNSSCFFLNKKNKNNVFIQLKVEDVESDMALLFKRCKLRMSQLNKIELTLKKIQCQNIQIKNICINPYYFITDKFQLITFDKAEVIEKEFNLKIEPKIKAVAWIIDLFLNKENTFYIKKWMFDSNLKKYCNERNHNYHEIYNYIKDTMIEQKIKNNQGIEDFYITTKNLLELEKKITDITLDLFYEINYEIDDDLINYYISEFEKRGGYPLELEQKQAVLSSIKNKLSIITGPPGTGKTTVVKCILYVFKQLYKKNKLNDSSSEDISENSSEYFSETDEYCFETFNNLPENIDETKNIYIEPKCISLLAPTGLAYINIQRQQIAENYNNQISGTCHRTLFHTFETIKKHKYLNLNDKFCGCETDECEHRFDINLPIIDEVSMLDMFLFEEILNMCKFFNSRLILIGDVNQLPSIGPGLVLKKLINCNLFNVIELKKIKRQQSGDLVKNIINMNIKLINKLDLTDETMQLIDINLFYDKFKKNIYLDKIKNFIIENNLNKHTTKFICYFKNTNYLFNTILLNNILQDLFNPLNEEFDKIPSNFKYENKFTFRVKDKIIRTENDYSNVKMRANGEEAEILDFDGKNVLIKYSGPDDKPEEIGIDELYENFTLNYCVTIHKSQGSQYINVVFFMEPENKIIDKQSMYTAISRAKEKCFIISTEEDFIGCQKNNKCDNKKISQFMEISDNYELINI